MFSVSSDLAPDITKINIAITKSIIIPNIILIFFIVPPKDLF